MDPETVAVMREEEITLEVQEQIAQEVHDQTVRLRQIDDQAFELSEAFHAAQDSEDEDEAAKLFAKLETKQRAGQQLRKVIDTLQHPSEQVRRVNDRLANDESLNRLKERKAKMAKETARDQGVPDEYLGENGNFKIGMDARYKSDLVSSALGIEDDARLHTFDAKDAEKRLAQRGWEHFLSRKREILAEKEKKAEERRAEKEQRDREKAEEKAKKDAEKAAAKEAKAAEKTTSTGKASGATGSKTDQARAQREAKATAAGK